MSDEREALSLKVDAAVVVVVTAHGPLWGSPLLHVLSPPLPLPRCQSRLYLVCHHQDSAAACPSFCSSSLLHVRACTFGRPLIWQPAKKFFFTDGT